MHIWQAIKMAAKSLWTNKLRSFLTMLGIIIGVVTVALLTSVVQGVSDAVISSIRSQSTLTFIYNMSPNMTYSSASSIIKSQQPTDETADDYFEFAIMVTSSSVVAATDLTGITDVNDFGLTYEKIDYTKEELEQMSDLQKLMASLKKKASPMSVTINMVDSNFNDIYELEFQGSFPTSSGEILVDEEFLETYLPNSSVSEAIGTTISLGVTYYTQIEITIDDTLTDEEISSIISYLSNATTNIESPGLGLTIIENDDGTNYLFENNVLTINIDFTNYYTNDDLESYLSLLDVVSSHSSDIVVSDIYEKDGAATYKIVGVLTEDSDEEDSSSASSSSTSGSFTSLLSSATKGNCYVLLTDENLVSCGVSASSVSDCVITCAYLRYNTETYMDESSTNLSAAFISAHYSYLTDFMIVSFSSVASIITDVMDLLTAMLAVISAVSLIVGGIGIMNIMLVSVTERTREIGVRKAIGAKRSSILVQFLIEALMLSLVGGLIGLGISWLGVVIIGNIMGFAMSIPGWVIAMSLGFCTAIGLIFGMFPAVKASRKQPIDALRHD